MDTFLGVMIPFIGTTLGAAMVLVMKKELGQNVHKLLLGVASGVMLAASVWSLLLPAIDKAEEQGVPSWLPAAVGFLLGIVGLLLLDMYIPRLHKKINTSCGVDAKAKRDLMLFLAVTLHNIPEGMAVGAVFAGLLSGNDIISLSAAFALSIGIAIQNFPEGAIVSLPLKNSGASRGKAFLYGTLSGIVEPIAAAVTILLASVMVPILPYLLAFAAGAMVYVVAEELIPGIHEDKRSCIGVIGLGGGFVIMMILDVVLG